VNIIYI